MRSFLKSAVVAGLIAVPIWSVSAQVMQPGLHVAFNTSTFSGEANTQFDFRTSFGGGVSLAFVFPSGFAIQPELRYIVKGATSDSAFISSSETRLRIKSTISYLEIPVLAVYSFNGGGSIRPRVFAGPYFASKLESSIEWQAVSGGVRQSEVDNSVESIDIGFVLGGGVEFDVAGERVLVGARGTFGRSDVRNRPDAPLRNTGLEIFTALIFQ
ncbi:MAG: PorT family protein [Rhodothermales bacterium]|nr:PorT family protein [Rhodothermales bacterium]